MTEDSKADCPICGDSFNSEEKMLSHFDSHSVEEKMKILKPDEGENTKEYSTTPHGAEPSYAWYLLPLLVPFLGGIVSYIAVRSYSEAMGWNMLFIGLVMTIVEVFVFNHFVFRFF